MKVLAPTFKRTLIDNLLTLIFETNRTHLQGIVNKFFRKNHTCLEPSFIPHVYFSITHLDTTLYFTQYIYSKYLDLEDLPKKTIRIIHPVLKEEFLELVNRQHKANIEIGRIQSYLIKLLASCKTATDITLILPKQLDTYMFVLFKDIVLADSTATLANYEIKKIQDTNIKGYNLLKTRIFADSFIDNLGD